MVVFSAGQAVFDEVANPKFLADVNAKADLLLAGIEEIVEAYPEVLSGVRGRGLLLGVQCQGVSPDAACSASPLSFPPVECPAPPGTNPM